MTKAKATEKNPLQSRKEVVGFVTSDKMNKTIVVKTQRKMSHADYGKFITKYRKVKAHDEGNTAKVGDLVRLVESRPLSKDKRWVLKEIMRRAGAAAALQVE